MADFNPRTNPISLGSFMGSHETMHSKDSLRMCNLFAGVMSYAAM